MKDLWSKLLSRVSQLDVAGIHHSCGRSTSQHERCVTHRRVNKDSQCRNDKTMVKIDNEFKMNWAHAADVERERPFFTGASQRQCLREATRGRCVSGARVQRRQGLPKNKGGEDSTSSARPVNQSKWRNCREVPADHEAQGQANAVTTAEVESEVADVRQTTAKRRLESLTKSPRWQSRTTVHDRKDDVRDVGLEAFENKASQLREWCPRGQRRRCLAQAVQAWMD